MKKDEFNSRLREHAKTLSPQPHEQDLIGTIYQSFNDLLGVNNCIQIGSYPRYTAITQVHDLDVLYFLGVWNENQHSPEKNLIDLKLKIESDYRNPTAFETSISLQSHSITIAFSDGREEFFSIDIVPAYIYSKNEFNDHTYKVPELLKKNHGKGRTELYVKLSESHSEMSWILTDPRGYIKTARIVNDNNSDFRKTVKLIKAWKSSCKKQDNNFKLKSFHIEQIVTSYFLGSNDLQLFDAIFRFFVELPNIIARPKIFDRADHGKYIDEYINELLPQEKEAIMRARDGHLIKMEEFTASSPVVDLFEAYFYVRAGNCERYLFDDKIPVLDNPDYSFSVMGEVQERKGGFRRYLLDKIGLIPIDRQIKFDIIGQRPHVDLFKWKVKNDSNSRDPRGEITDHHTKSLIERTEYSGEHFVECYAILDNMCVAKARQNVILKPGYYNE